MSTTDKRDECGCHRTCTVLPHECAVPCVWPSCLTDEELAAVDAELAEDAPGWFGMPTGPRPGESEALSNRRDSRVRPLEDGSKGQGTA